METLAVKYRPKTFADITEQDIVKRILCNQLETKTTKNAYLFVGPAGCGKTTAARIFANDINQGYGTPIEIDAASNNGVDNVRSIIDQSKYKSINSEFKVFIIDEVHMLSTGAWNALLKLLEEPPAGTVFIMCTTDPQKIPATIISRVQRYDFHKISMSGLESRLKYILNEEYHRQGIIEDNGINYIAKQANGGMRDAISLMDKCLSFYPDKQSPITIDEIIDCLGTVNYEIMFNLLMYILYKDTEISEMLKIINDIFDSGKDLKQFMRNFFLFVNDVLKYAYTKDIDITLLPNNEAWKDHLNGLISDSTIIRRLLIIMDKVMSLNSEIKYMSMVKSMVEASLMLLREEVGIL